MKYKFSYNTSSINIVTYYNGKLLRDEALDFSEKSLVLLIATASLLPALNFHDTRSDEELQIVDDVLTEMVK
ncbi:hypothetical protein D3C79_1027340 [compost metagenome]